jgi:DNA-binding MarR family transcriptional regulator
MSLKEEIKQNRPFGSQLEEALLNIVRTASQLTYEFNEAFKPYGVTTTQYNVLRILRGAGPAGLPCGAIAERLLTRDSDVTRLLDRLTSQHLVERGRSDEDRRVVVVRITPAGTDLLERMQPVLLELQQRQLGHLDSNTITALIHGLEQARIRPVTTDSLSHA